MKHPWIVFSTICSLVMGIVLICIIFGGYSSLLRSQSRINTVKQMLAEQCTAQANLALHLTTLAQDHEFGGQKNALALAARQLKSILVPMVSGKDPLNPNLIQKFETAQVRITQGIEAMTAGLKKDMPKSKMDAILGEQKEVNTAIIVMVKQYNKEATYFNTRSRQFPGMFIAKLFNLDHLRFPQIIPPALIREETASAS